MSARSGLVGKRTSRPHLGPPRVIFCVGRKNAKMPKFCLFSLVGQSVVTDLAELASLTILHHPLCPSPSVVSFSIRCVLYHRPSSPTDRDISINYYRTTRKIKKIKIIKKKYIYIYYIYYIYSARPMGEFIKNCPK